MKTDGIKVKGHVGTWYVIADGYHDGKRVFLLESEQFGNDAAWLIVDGHANLIMDEVYNGLNDLSDL